MTRHQAHRTLRLDARYIGVALVLVSAAVSAVVIWLALALLLSLGTYVETVIP